MAYASESALLILTQGEGTRERWSLGPKDNTIGRGDDNDIVLAVREVSRLHAIIWQEKGRWKIEDQDSRNGTFVNSEQLSEPRFLKDGDQIQIADQFSFLFVDVDVTAPTNWKDEVKSLIELDVQSRRVWVVGREVKPELSPIQFSLLQLLYENKGELVSREDVARLLWPEAEGIISEQAIDSLIWRLRNRLSKVDDSRDYVITVRGHGFRLQYVF